MTVADLAAWRANTAPAVASALARLHAQLLGCLTDLEAQLMQQLASAQAAAAAAEQVRSTWQRVVCPAEPCPPSILLPLPECLPLPTVQLMRMIVT
jgi:hypothetical protein